MSEIENSVAILNPNSPIPHYVSSIQLDTLEWPLGRSYRLSHGTVADMQPTDHLILMPRQRFWYKSFKNVRAKVTLSIAEPKAIHRQHYWLAKIFNRRFHKILSADPDLARTVPNAEVFAFGSTWVPDWESLDTSKSRNLSIIASSKKYLAGHKLRHKCVDWMVENNVDVDVMGRGYKPFDTKSDGLAPYRFSVVIENTREENYFTEKLMDALLCKTVPIYWGCPNISDYFDTEGMIICQSFDDLKSAIFTANEDVYASKAAGIENNIPKAAYYGDFYGRLAKAVSGEA